MSEGRLAGKVALITGGSSGIGRACAMRFAEEGADIVIADRDAVRGAEAVAEIRAAVNGRAGFVPVDVASEESVEAMADRAIAEFGRVDTTVAAAGISSAGYVSGDPQERDADFESRQLVNMSLEAWQKVLDVNLTGVMLTNRAIARRMIASGHSGTLVNLASSAARIALPGAAEYCVSKAGLAMVTQLFAARLGEYGLPVFEVRPGVTRTDMTAGVAEKYDRLIDEGLCVTRRWGHPEDAGKVVVALAAGSFAYSTGQVVMVDGGLTIPRL